MMHIELDCVVAEGVGPVQLCPLPPAPPPGSNLGLFTVGNTDPVQSIHLYTGKWWPGEAW